MLAGPAAGSIAESYNVLLDRARELDGLEALVVVHQDTELVDDDFCAIARRTLAEPGVGLIGCAGAVDVRSIAWWESSVTLANFANRYEEHGGGDLPGFSWDREDVPPHAEVGDVETLDGFALVFTPWAIAHVRFDERLSRFHGYDLDYCLQVREAGRRVMTADFRAIHHRPLEMIPDPEEWIEAHVRVAEKWDGRMPPGGATGGSWRERALRAEAERDAATLLAYWRAMELEAQVHEIGRLLETARRSFSWRVTAPLRRLTAGARGRRAAVGP